MKLLITALLAVACLSSAIAGDVPFAGAGTAVSTNLAYFITPHPGSGRALFSFINATSDMAAGAATFYTLGTATMITNTAAVATNFVRVASGGDSFTSNDVAVVYHTTLGTLERAVVHTPAAGSVQFTANLLSVNAPGDILYKATSAGTIPIANTTKEINSNPGFFFAGTVGAPTLVSVSSAGTNASPTINAIAGVLSDPTAATRR